MILFSVTDTVALQTYVKEKVHPTITIISKVKNYVYESHFWSYGLEKDCLNFY